MRDVAADAGVATDASTNEAISRSVQLVVSVVSQTTVIVGSLFYFGYVRASSTFSYLGLDISLLGFSTVDYVIRSGNSIFVPVLILACLLLYFRLAVELLRRLLALRPRNPVEDKNGARTAWVAAVVIASTCILVVPPALQWSFGDTIRAGVFFLFVLVAGLVSIITTGLSGVLRSGRLRTLLGSLAIPVSTIAVAIFFFATALQAQDVGVRVGRQVEQGAADRPSIVVYSETPLGVADGNGITVEPLGEASGRYKYRIVGLRLLIASDDKYFLMKPKERASRADVVVIAEQEVRIDVTGG